MLNAYKIHFNRSTILDLINLIDLDKASQTIWLILKKICRVQRPSIGALIVGQDRPKIEICARPWLCKIAHEKNNAPY